MQVDSAPIWHAKSREHWVCGQKRHETLYPNFDIFRAWECHHTPPDDRIQLVCLAEDQGFEDLEERHLF